MLHRSYLEELKTKPDSHKKQVALFASLAITALVIIIWLISFRFLSSGQGNNNLSARAVTPLNEIKTTIENSTKNVVNGVGQAKANLQGIFNTIAGDSLDASNTATDSAPAQRQL